MMISRIDASPEEAQLLEAQEAVNAEERKQSALKEEANHLSLFTFILLLPSRKCGWQQSFISLSPAMQSADQRLTEHSNSVGSSSQYG